MTIAFVLCATDIGKEKRVWKKIIPMDTVKEAHIIYGGYDIVIKVVTNSIEELSSVVSRIKEIKGVQSVSSLIASDSYEDQTRGDKTRIY
ncbi:MAG: Lrp/AsnC ligand binding domain-containing protein [Candidatus Methanofastidiosia archaeon]|jgi:DNA-binding Lrp family transcriptional regulator